MNDLLLLEYSNFIKDYNGFFDFYLLTQREREITFLINKGKKNRDIGNTLFISETTVKKHVYNIYNKLNINSRLELICILRDSIHSNNSIKAC